jgi:hypothetical protein
MGLAWQQGPLAAGSVGRFLVPDPLPERLLYAEHLDGARLRLEPGQSVIPHGPDRDLTTDELAPGRQV